MKPWVVVRFEGVLYGHGGAPIRGALEAMRQLAEFARIRILTGFKAETEPFQPAPSVLRWLREHDFPFDEVEGEESVAAAYIDSRAICCRPDSPFVGMLGEGTLGIWRETLAKAKNFCEGH